MLEVLYSTGLRVSELIGLRVSDLDSKVGCVRCIGKGDKERIVPVGRKALAMVDKYLRDARPKLLGKLRGSPTLFVNRRGVSLSRVGVWKILSAYGRRAGLRGFAYAAHAAPQFRDASAGARRGPAFGATHARPRGHFHHANLHPRSGGAVEADLQSASSPRMKCRSVLRARSGIDLKFIADAFAVFSRTS